MIRKNETEKVTPPPFISLFETNALHLCERSATDGESDVSLVHVQQGHTSRCFLERTGIDPTQCNVGRRSYTRRA